MTQALTLPVAGLMTDPGPFTAAPDGGFAEAQNVVVLRPGVVEPRPGFTWRPDSGLKGTHAAEALYVDPSDVPFIVAQGATWLIRKSQTTTVTGPTAFTAGKVRIEPTGGRALLTSDNGVCTLPGQVASPASGSATVAYRAGMPQPYCPRCVLVVAATGFPAGANWLPNNESTAYRVTLRRKLADGTIVESAPSSRVVVANTAGAARAVTLVDWSGNGLVAWWPGGVLGAQGFNALIVGDELCIYRAPRSTGTPSDEMMLRAVLPWDVATATFIDPRTGLPWVDHLDDSQWSGPALYTNATQEGIAFANYRPEYARDIALYNGMTFYGGAKTPQRLDITLRALFRTGGTVNDPSQGLLTFAFTAAIVSGSPNITIAGGLIRYFSIGQIVVLSTQAPGTATASFPANTYVTAINTSTNVVTLSANAGATNATANCIGWDWIEAVAPGAPVTPSTSRIYYDCGVGTAPGRTFTATAATGAEALENTWNGTLDTSIQLRCTGVTQTTEILCSFFQPDPSSAAFAVRSSKALAWDAYVDNVTGVVSEQYGAGGAGLMWSKVNEPESVPIPYSTTIGDAAYPIRRIVVAKNSLLIFKDDGLFQAYGKTPDTLVFELLDSTIVLPTVGGPLVTTDYPSKWLGRFDDRVYAMTVRGPMMITDAGGTLVGAPILETLRDDIGGQFGGARTLERTIAFDFSERRVLFFIAASTAPTAGSRAYVMGIDDGVWTTWTTRFQIAASSYRMSPRVSGFLSVAPYALAGGYAYGTTNLRPWTSFPTCDRWETTAGGSLEQVTVLSVTGSGPYTVTIASGSNWAQPEIGDTVGGLIGAGVVTGVTSATVFETDADPGTGLKFWQEGYPIRAIWLARAEGNVPAEKHWSSFVLPFERVSTFGLAKFYFKGYRNTDPAVEGYINPVAAADDGSDPGTSTPAYANIAVPSAVARDWALKVGFTIQRAMATFSTAGASVLFNQLIPNKAAR